MKRKAKISLILALSMLITCIPITTYVGNAGSIKSYTTLTSGLSFTNWYYTDDIGEAFTDGIIVFGEQSNRVSRIISNKKVNNMKSSGKEEWMNAEITLKITDAPEGKRFGLAFGLNNPSARICSENSNFLYFTAADGGLKVGLSKFDNDGAETSLFTSQTAVCQVGEDINLLLRIDVQGKVEISINGTKMLVDQTVTVNADGYVGFGQDGKFNAQISSVSVMAYENSTPLNCDIFEVFNGGYNANLIYTYGVTGYNAPSYAKVEDGKFVFLNTGSNKDVSFSVIDNSSGQNVSYNYFYDKSSYLSTRYAYSNVDLSFDLQFVGNGAEDTSGFSLILGRDEPEETGSFLKLEAEKLAKGIKQDLWEIRFTKSDKSRVGDGVTAFIELYNGKKLVDKVTLDDKDNLFSDANYGKKVGVWAQMIDGKLTVWFKIDGQNFFRKVYQADLLDTPNGCVQIRANGSPKKAIFSTLGNMAIDNLSVTNFDLDAKKQAVTFRTNVWDTSDFEYEDTWNDKDIYGGK